MWIFFPSVNDITLLGGGGLRWTNTGRVLSRLTTQALTCCPTLLSFLRISHSKPWEALCHWYRLLATSSCHRWDFSQVRHLYQQLLLIGTDCSLHLICIPHAFQELFHSFIYLSNCLSTHFQQQHTLILPVLSTNTFISRPFLLCGGENAGR